jgi:MFS transporter, DHA1 family, multidrug resistance protein
MNNPTLLTLLLSVFIALLGIGIIVPILPVFARELGASGFSLGMIIAAFSVTRGLLLPAVGNLSDRWGRKGFLVAGLLIYGLVGLLIPHATSVGNLIAIRGFHGVGSAMIVPIGMAYMSLLAPAGEEGRYMSYLNIAIFSGIGCGPLIGGLIFDLWGVAAVFYLMALLSFAAFFLVIRHMPRHLAGDRREKPPGLLQSLMKMLRSRKTCGILLARYTTMIIMVPTMAFLPLIMAGWQDSTGLQIGMVIACRTIVNALLQIPLGKLADRSSKLTILLAGSACIAIAVFLIPSITSLAQIIVLYLCLGAFEAAVWAVLGAYASIEAKEHYGHGTMMGVFSFAMSGGIFTGAVLCGFSMDRWGIDLSYHVAGATVLILSLVAAVLIATAGEKPARG